MRKTWMALGLVALVALAGCGSDGSEGSSDGGPTTTKPSTSATEPASTAAAPTTDDLDGRTFVSSSVTGYDLVADSQISLSFDGARMGANAGCNQSSGGYSIADGTLKWDGPAATTQMARNTIAMTSAMVPVSGVTA